MERQKIGGQMGKAATKSSPLESTKLSYSLWAYIVTAYSVRPYIPYVRTWEDCFIFFYFWLD